MAYIKTQWLPDQPPGISDEKLNIIEQGIVDVETIALDNVKIEVSGLYIMDTSFHCVAILNDSYSIIDVGIALMKTIVDGVENPIAYNCSEWFRLQLNTITSQGVIYTCVPGSSSTTRYLINYYFETTLGIRRLYVKLASALSDHVVKTKWIYKE